MKYLILGIILILHLVILQQLVFTAWPEMLSYPYLLSKGFTIYKDAAIPYPPALPVALEVVFSIAGFSPDVLKGAAWIVIAILDLNLFLIILKVTKEVKITFVLMFCYVILQSVLDGNMMWFELAGLVPISFTLVFLLRWTVDFSVKYLLIAIFFLTLATLIKQTNFIYFLPLGLTYFVFGRKVNLKEVFFSVAVISLMWMPVILNLFTQKNLSQFLLWNFWYTLTFWSKFPGYVDFIISRKEAFVLGLLCSPLVYVVFKRNRLIFAIISFLMAAAAAVYPRFSFFHLQPALFILMVVVGMLYLRLGKVVQKIFIVQLVIVSLLIARFQQPFISGAGQIRFASSDDYQLSDQIRKVTHVGDTIYLLGPSSSEYVFSQTIPPKPWIDNFGWYLEIPTVQQQVIEGLKKDKPKFVFWQTPLSGQWYQLGVYQPQQIIAFITEHYVQSDNLRGGVMVWTKRD